MKKEVDVCDQCNQNLATKKCRFCEKDLCGYCSKTQNFAWRTFSEENENSLFWCGSCFKKGTRDGNIDLTGFSIKKFEEFEEMIIKFLKAKIFAKKLEGKKKEKDGGMEAFYG